MKDYVVTLIEESERMMIRGDEVTFKGGPDGDESTIIFDVKNVLKKRKKPAISQEFMSSPLGLQIKKDLMADQHGQCLETGFSMREVERILTRDGSKKNVESARRLQLCPGDGFEGEGDEDSSHYELRCRGSAMLDDRPYIDRSKLSDDMKVMIGAFELVD